MSECLPSWSDVNLPFHIFENYPWKLLQQPMTSWLCDLTLETHITFPEMFLRFFTVKYYVSQKENSCEHKQAHYRRYIELQINWKTSKSDAGQSPLVTQIYLVWQNKQNSFTYVQQFYFCDVKTGLH